MERGCDFKSLADYVSLAIGRMRADQARKGRRSRSELRHNQRLAKRLREMAERVVSDFKGREYSWGEPDPHEIQLENDVSLYHRTSRRLAEAAEHGELRRKESSPRVQARIWRFLLLEHIHERAGVWPWRRVFAILEECAETTGLDFEKISFSEESFRQETYRLRKQWRLSEERTRAAEESIREAVEKLEQARRTFGDEAVVQALRGELGLASSEDPTRRGSCRNNRAAPEKNVVR